MSLGVEKFSKDIEVGEIHQRNRGQFELKSVFIPSSRLKTNSYSQEFYFFIPNSLQINSDTYTKIHFYQDQTNLTRYKTPAFTLKELMNGINRASPFTRFCELLSLPMTAETISAMQYELKLLGNVVRTALRTEIQNLLKLLDSPHPPESFETNCLALCQDIRSFRHRFLEKKNGFIDNSQEHSLKKHYEYVDEFISNFINFYLTGLVERLQTHSEISAVISDELFEVLALEKKHREENLQEPVVDINDPVASEAVFYRKGLLGKFVFDVLHLDAMRSSLDKRFRTLIGSFAAAIAMLFFFVLFIWQGGVFLVNSIPFILITVLLYVLKDRLKEELKILSYRQFHKWFPDYATRIKTFNGKGCVGEIRESFSFIDENEVPQDILDIRKREFHPILEAFKQPEQIIYYKKRICMYQQPKEKGLSGLNLIFRFNINHFLVKADDPFHPYVTVDPFSKKILKTLLPKVYHLNIILKNTYVEDDLSERIELKKFRIILDKDGIKRVEQIR